MHSYVMYVYSYVAMQRMYIASFTMYVRSYAPIHFIYIAKLCSVCISIYGYVNDNKVKSLYIVPIATISMLVKFYLGFCYLPL